MLRISFLRVEWRILLIWGWIGEACDSSKCRGRISFFHEKDKYNIIRYICCNYFIAIVKTFKASNKSFLYPVSKTWKPVNFQGAGKKSHYFEGWYFKNVSADQQHIWSVIPGISIENIEKQHAFIQLINGKTAETWYVKYPIGSFSYSQRGFRVSIDNNTFSLQGISLDIADEIEISGQINFQNIHPLKSLLFNPGIMGWYSFVPFMECFHGLVSMDHDLSGQLKIDGKPVSFENGKGYSEKDWGRSMPEAWIWMQCNHFEQPRTSFMLSIAKIPWLKSSFTGFLCVLLLNGKIHRFATYTGARLKNLSVDTETVQIEISDKNYHLGISARHAAHGLLAAPLSGAMDRRIAESVDAEIMVRVTESSGKEIFSGTGKTAGLELVGDMEELPV